MRFHDGSTCDHFRTVLLSLTLVSLAASPACRKNKTVNSNSNGGSNVSNGGDPELARRQAQSLVETGKELYKNDQDEQAVETFKQAINQDPNNAEAHLRLGMSYAALDKKTEADEEYKKAIDLFKKRIQADSKTETRFYLGEAHTFLHRDEEAVRSYRQSNQAEARRRGSVLPVRNG